VCDTDGLTNGFPLGTLMMMMMMMMIKMTRRRRRRGEGGDRAKGGREG